MPDNCIYCNTPFGVTRLGNLNRSTADYDICIPCMKSVTVDHISYEQRAKYLRIKIKRRKNEG